jgi:adenine/guanine phosphoribosyltransferase-like PRPP-binding protein
MVNEYKYFVYPFKGITPIKSTSLRYLTEILCDCLSANREKARTIATVMTDGLITALPVAMRLKKDLLVARDFHYNYHDALSLQQKTGYSTRQLYVAHPNDILEPVAFIDAVVSTGQTALGIIETFRQAGLAISRVYAVVNKIEYGGEARLREAGIKFEALFDVKIQGNQVICLNREESRDVTQRAGRGL